MLEPVIFTLATIGTALPLVDSHTFLSLVATGSAALALTQDPVVQQCFITTADLCMGTVFLGAAILAVFAWNEDPTFTQGAAIFSNFNAAKERFAKVKKGLCRIFLKERPAETQDKQEPIE
jgi:hypothetical protein